MAIPTFEEFRKQKYGAAYSGPFNGPPQETPDPEAVKQLFLMESMRNPKQASNLSTIFKSFVAPQEEGADLTATQKSKKDLLKSILMQTQAIQQKNPNFAGSGFIKGTWTNLMKNILPGTVDEQSRQLQGDIGPVRDSIMNYLSGAGVTGSEAQRLKEWMLSITNAPETNKANLQSIENYAKMNLSSILGTPYQPTDMQQPAAEPILMTGPDGKQYKVPPEKVNLFRQNGYR